MGERVGQVVLDRAAKQCDCLIISARVSLAAPAKCNHSQAKLSRGERRRSLRLFVGSSFFRVTDKNLSETDVRRRQLE